MTRFQNPDITSQSARGLAHSKTLHEFTTSSSGRQSLECGGERSATPLSLFEHWGGMEAKAVSPLSSASAFEKRPAEKSELYP